jgi:hypothetical protein
VRPESDTRSHEAAPASRARVRHECRSRPARRGAPAHPRTSDEVDSDRA